MKTSTKGLTLIKAHEGLRLQAYKCPSGVWTIGYGHTATAAQGMVITAQQAEDLLRRDLATAEKNVLSHGLNLNQNRFDALVSFVFNVGGGNFSRSTLLRKIKANHADPSITSEFLKWNKGAGKVLPGLEKRRREEADLYFKPL